MMLTLPPALLAIDLDEVQSLGNAILLGCWVFPATIMACIVMVTQWRRHWPKLPRGERRSARDYPTSAGTRRRCATCAYPLEPFQARCPECGSPRSSSTRTPLARRR